MRNGKVETDLAMMAELATLAAQVKFDFVRIFRGFLVSFILQTLKNCTHLHTLDAKVMYMSLCATSIFFLSSFLFKFVFDDVPIISESRSAMSQGHPRNRLTSTCLPSATIAKQKWSSCLW